MVGIICLPIEIGLIDLLKTEGGWGKCPPGSDSPDCMELKGGDLRNKDSEMKLSPKGHSKPSSKIFFMLVD